MRVGLSDIDVFSFVDSDSDEAKTFTTYLGYVLAFDALLTSEWGPTPYEHLQDQLERTGALQKLRSKRFTGAPMAVQSLLVNAWLHEMHLHIIDGTDAGRVRIANHSAAVNAYYATSRAASAWHCALTSAAPVTHRGLLAAMDKLVTNSPILYPSPWNLRCTQLLPTPTYQGFPSVPGECSNLSTSATPHDLVAMCLRTTRLRRVQTLVDETKRQLKKARAPNGEKLRRDSKLHATSMFDFLWRSRTRSSYGDPAMFYMGAIGDDDVLAYMSALRRITASTTFLFETFLAQRAPAVLGDAATHFISRDRSRLTDEILVPRLAALGIAGQIRRPASRSLAS